LQFSSCFNLEEESSFGLSDSEYQVAIPLINSKITVNKIADKANENTSIRIDANGKATVLFNGEVIRRSTAAIFPPFPGLFPYPIPDTLSDIKLQFNSTYLIKKATFKDTKIKFTFENNLALDVKVNMRLPGVTKNGVTFEKDFVIKYNNSLPAKLITEELSLDGWTLESETNSIRFHYQAILPNGEKIKLDFAQMSFDIIKFAYLDGYLGYHVFAVDGSIIDVGLFNSWLSGSFDFEDPKITISVDNAFGLPVRSLVNKMELTSITGKTVNLESEFISKGIDFAYPSFSQLGQIKQTSFRFDKSNSNIREIFNEKTKTIAYDISALVNPEKDTTIKGFITDGSFFVVNVAVEVPLFGSINNVVITDTVDFNINDLREIVSVKFKAITSNDFPADMTIQAYFLDQNGNPIDYLFEESGFVLKAANLLPSGLTTPGTEKINYIDFDKQRFDKIRNSKRLAIVAKMNTIMSDQKNSLWVYKDYGIGLKLGAIVNYKQN
jgi:hypothetical protein